MYIFETESKLINKARNRAQRLMASLAIAAALPLGAAIAIEMPRPLKAAAMGTSLASAIALLAAAGKSAKNEKAWDFIDEQQEAQYYRLLEFEAKKATILDYAAIEAEMLEILEQLPPYQAWAYAREWGNALGTDLAAKLGFDEYGNWMGAAMEAIAVPAQTIQEQPAIAAAPQPTAASPSFTVATSVAPATPQDAFPTEDIAALMAQASCDTNICGSILIACPKGTGKSNLINAAIAKINERAQGNVDFYIFNGKELDPGKNFCGLEKSPDDYLYVDTDTVVETHDRLAAISNTRLKEYAGFPTVVISDEWNNSLITAQMYDTANPAKGRSPYSKLLNMLIYQIITKGRSKLVSNIITSHSPFVQDVGQNTAIQQSMSTVVLSRRSETGAILSALSGQRSIVDNVDLRARLYQQFLDYLNSPQFDPNRVVALTNLVNGWRLVFLPRYPDAQPEIVRSPLNQSNTEIAYGNNPPTDVPAAAQPAKASLPTPEISTEKTDVYSAIATSEIELGRQLTDTELKGIYLRFAAVILPDEALPSLRAAIANKKEELRATATA